jgi:hypothetical protein
MSQMRGYLFIQCFYHRGYELHLYNKHWLNYVTSKLLENTTSLKPSWLISISQSDPECFYFIFHIGYFSCVLNVTAIAVFTA